METDLGSCIAGEYILSSDKNTPMYYGSGYRDPRLSIIEKKKICKTAKRP